MNEGIELDVHYLRRERANEHPNEVLVCAAQVREYATEGNEGHAEATLHMAWAYTELRRYREAKKLYIWLMEATGLGLSLHIQVQRDYALLLHRTGKQDEAVELIGRALSTTDPEHDAELHSSVAAAVATITQAPRS